MLIVTTPAENFDLISLSDAQILVTRADNAFLSAAITRASDLIARHCKRVFAKETVTETLRLDQSKNDLILARYPVSAIVSVVEGNTPVDPTGYELNGDSGVLRRLQGDGTIDGWWPASRITVAYTAGYDLPAGTPDALRQATMRLVRSFSDISARDLSVKSSDTPGVLTRSFLEVDHLLLDIRTLLLQFRNLRVG